METKEYHTVDKSSWPEGAWKTEPDKKQWRDEETGLPCLIVRNTLGALCGYVGVYKDHPLFEKKYNQLPSDIEDNIHGGLTFADHCHEGTNESLGICHYGDEKGEVWWFGFDCAHLMDFAPNLNTQHATIRKNLFPHETYRDIPYVMAEVQKLAKMLASADN